MLPGSVLFEMVAKVGWLDLTTTSHEGVGTVSVNDAYNTHDQAWLDMASVMFFTVAMFAIQGMVVAIEDGKFGLVWVPRSEMIADIGNQPQTYATHRTFASKLRGQELPEKLPIQERTKRKKRDTTEASVAKARKVTA